MRRFATATRPRFERLDDRILLALPPVGGGILGENRPYLPATIVLTDAGISIDGNPVAPYASTPGSFAFYGDNSTALIIDDQIDAGSSTYQLLSDRLILSTSNPSVNVPLLGFYEITSLTILGGSGTNTFNISATPSSGPLEVDARAGSTANTYNVGLGSVAAIGGLTIAGAGGSNTLNFDDSLNNGGDDVALSSGQIALPPGVLGPGQPNLSVAYAGMSSLNLTTGAGADRFEVGGTAPGTATAIDAGAGDDRVDLAPNGFAGAINAVDVDGGAGSNALSFSDAAYAGQQALALTGSSIAVPMIPGGAGLPGLAVNYANFGTLNVTEGPGPDLIDVFGTNPSTATTINGGDGDDTFSVLPGATGQGGAVLLNGGAGANVLLFFDADQSPSDTLYLSPTSIVVGPSATPTAGGSIVGYSAMSNLVVSLGAGRTLVLGTAPGTQTYIGVGGSANTVRVGDGDVSLVRDLTVDGGGSGSLLFDDSAATRDVSLEVSADQITAPSLPGLSVRYARLSGLLVITGSGDDVVSVSSTPSFVPVTISTGTGDDAVVVGSLAAGVARVGLLTVDGGSGANVVRVVDAAPTSNRFQVSSAAVTSRSVPGFAVHYSAIGAAVVAGKAHRFPASTGAPRRKSGRSRG